MSAADALNQHVRDVVQWHFSPDTGTPFWRDWAAAEGREYSLENGS